jgi:hypothetical protein
VEGGGRLHAPDQGHVPPPVVGSQLAAPVSERQAHEQAE